jgi:hypothetical protein
MEIYTSLTTRLKCQHQAIPHLIRSVKQERLFYREFSEKWSIHDNIAHLARYQPVFTQRIQTMLEENNPCFERYTADTDHEFETWRKRTTTELLMTLEEDRQKMIAFLASLKKEQLTRTGEHKKFGTMTIVQWTEFFLLHEAHHLFTIFKLAQDVDLEIQGPV